MSLPDFFAQAASETLLFYTHHPTDMMKNIHNRICQQNHDVNNGKKQEKPHVIKSPQNTMDDSSQEDLRFFASYVALVIIVF